jgi:hypothetical protein
VLRSLSTLFACKPAKPHFRRKLEIQTLEERATPVVGAWDIPTPIGPGAGFDGVARIANGSGALLNTARHMLTAGHVGTQDTGPGSGSSAKFDMPWGVATIGSAERHPHPDAEADGGYGNWSNYDMAIIELDELGPLTAERWGIYTGDSEVGKDVKFYGYGKPGTGTSGHTSEVGVTAPGSGNTELARLSFSGKPTGGSYTLTIDGLGSVNLAWNATPAQIETALESLDTINDVWARKLYGINPYAGSIEIQFKDIEGDVNDLPNLKVQSFLVGGGATVKTLINGDNPRAKRTGMNHIATTTNDDKRLWADFDDGTSTTDRFEDGGPLANGKEASFAHGDSGGPMFIGNKIAGVNTKLDGGVLDSDPDNADFGHEFGWERVSTAQDFINGVLDKSFNLVLNMNNQAPGNDGGAADKITFQGVNGKLQILFGNSVVYSEALSKILSIRLIGSDDAETITFKNINSAIPVVIESNGGDDTIKVEKNILATVDIFAGDGKDTITLGHADGFGLFANAVEARGENGNDTFKVINNRVNDLEVSGGDDDDFIQIEYVSQNNFAYAGGQAGNDEIHIGTGNLRTQILGGVVAEPGGDQFDELHINDQLNTDLADYILKSDSLDKSAGFSGNIGFSDVPGLWVNTNGKGTTIHVQSTSLDTVTHVNAGDGDDTLIFGDAALQFVRGQVYANGGAGKDTFDPVLILDGTYLALQGGTNNDTFLLGHGNVSQAIQGAIDIDGDQGYDRLEMDDQLDAGADAYTLTDLAFKKDGMNHNVTFDTLESITLRANDENNTINVKAAKANASIKVLGNGGDDEIVVGTGILGLTLPHATISAHGGFGLDTLVIDDSNNGADTINTLFANSFQQQGVDLKLTFDWMNTVNLKSGVGDDLIGVVGTIDDIDVLLETGPGNDKVFVQKSGVDSSINVDAGSDNDEVYLAPFGLDLDAIGGPVSVAGGGGTDKVFVNDQNDTEQDQYRIDSTKVEKKNALGLNNGGGGGGNGWRTILEYQDLDQLDVNANSAKNDIEIVGTHAGTNTKVNGGAGNDKFTVQQPPAFDLTLNGAADIDTAYLKGTDGNDNVQIQGTTFDFAAQSRVILQNVENTNYDGKDGLDTVNYAGKQGQVDAVQLTASTTPGTGVLDVPGIIKVNFKNSEMFDVAGNVGETDTFVMNGTSANDRYEISMHASGTPGDRFVELFAQDSTRLLALIDAKNVGQAKFKGLAGNDLFHITAGPFGSIDERKVLVDGGAQLDIRGDVISVEHVGAETPTVNKQAKQGDPDAGSISVDFLSHQFDIDYDGMETVNV